MHRSLPHTTRMLALAALVAGCAGDPPPEDLDVAQPELSVVHAQRAQRPAPEPPRDSAKPAEIYYDLTRYEWYARGEPLLVDGAPYTPAGPPIPLDAEIERIGEHEGVAYYARSALRDTVLVPVFEGYWQPFVVTNDDAPSE